MKSGSYVSVISRIELLGWKGHTEKSFKGTKDVLERLTEYPLNNNIVEECILLRKKHRIKLPDAIIASTALYLNIPLVTRNTDDFDTIKELTLINPFGVDVAK